MKYLVVRNHGQESESISYCGESEVEAFKKYKTIEGKKNIFISTVKNEMMFGADFILSYEIIEIIK